MVHYVNICRVNCYHECSIFGRSSVSKATIHNLVAAHCRGGYIVDHPGANLPRDEVPARGGAEVSVE